MRAINFLFHAVKVIGNNKMILLHHKMSFAFLLGCLMFSGNAMGALVSDSGNLVLSSDFQQIGDAEEGGGTTRMAAKLAAMTSDDPNERKRLSKIADAPQAITEEIANDLSLSGVEEWLHGDDMFDEQKAVQMRTFGPYRLLVWRDEVPANAVALYRDGKFQFGWEGYGLATTGPLRPTSPKEDAWILFEGPSAGTDLDGDGIPDILVYDYSGGAHCCSTVKHIVCSNPPVLTAQISGWHATPSYKDLDHDGDYEMSIRDSSYAYWNACYADSPAPMVIYRIHHGQYEMAEDLMRKQALLSGQIKAQADEFKEHLARMDQFMARNQLGDAAPSKMSVEEEQDDNFFALEGWGQEGVMIPPAVWTFLLDLIYSGQVDETVASLDEMWPTGKPGKADFANDLLEMVRGSYYGSRLPWFKELERTFAQHYPKSGK